MIGHWAWEIDFQGRDRDWRVMLLSKIYREHSRLAKIYHGWAWNPSSDHELLQRYRMVHTQLEWEQLGWYWTGD